MEAAQEEIRLGYKLTKVGWIPKDWVVTKLGKHTTKVGSGSTPRGGDKVYTENGIPFLRSQNVNDNKLILHGIKYIPEHINDKMKGTFVKPNDVLLNITGASIGRSCVVPVDFLEANVNQHVCIIRLKKDELIPEFVQEFLSTYQGQKTIFRSQLGGNREGLNHQGVRGINIPQPPLLEQKAIAQVLSTWDKAIEDLTQLISEKQQKKKALMQQLLSGKKRFPGFGGEWKEYTYKKLLKEVKRPVNWDDNEFYHLISVRRRSGGLFERESLYGQQIKTKNLRTANEGDFLISKMQIVHGASGMVTNDFDGQKISGSYIAVRSRNDRLLDINFLNWYSKMLYFYHQTYISSYGVHIEKMTFDFKSFLKLSMKVPSLEEQKKIVATLEVAESELTVLNQKLDKMKVQKKGLMQQLLTGKKRLKY